MAPTISYCVVNTNGRKLLLACLEAIEQEHPSGVEGEVLVLDNASDDGSAEAVRQWERERKSASGESKGTPGSSPGAGQAGQLRLIALDQRQGKAANDSRLMGEAAGEFCLLLNEDSELQPGAARTLLAALEADPKAGAAGAQLLTANGEPYPCAWRFPGVATALIGAAFLHRWFTVQSGGEQTREVGWAQSSALLVRRHAASEIGYMDPDFFVYYDECDFSKRLADAGWSTLYVPSAQAIHHDQLATDFKAGLPRIVEFHRNRDLYMRKHHSAAEAAAVRILTAWSYGLRALAATALRRPAARVYRAHARQALLPGRGTSIRDRAEAG